MACKASHELNHHFPKLAEESGFTFNTHRARIRIDWNKIRLIDIDNIIRERKYSLIEQHVNDILDCVLESEFDVRILDEGVLKMFRLAQLAVEYQLFCRHYLDRSVYVLREEVSSLARELDATKRELREKDEELKKYKRKTKHPYKPQLTYGNENIATMILKTLANKGDIFPSTSNTDALQYNKCSFCDKVFLNQLYLKSHISRRHSNVNEMPEKDFAENSPGTGNTQLNEEIKQLKIKLKEMEELFTKNMTANHIVSEDKVDVVANNISHEVTKKMKDAEVSTGSDGYILDKIEEWKTQEHEKYNKEINLLRNQIIETMNDLKKKDEQKREVTQKLDSDHDLVPKLHTTIKQQGEEILGLKQQLNDLKIISQSEEALKRREKENLIKFWEKKAEEQSKQYESLVEKLNAIAKEAHESKTLAEAERQRAVQLEDMLQRALTSKNIKANDNPKQFNNGNDLKNNTKISPESDHIENKNTYKPNKMTDSKTLEKLHQKAQELLNVGIISSSDISSESSENEKQTRDSPNYKKSVETLAQNVNGHTNNTVKHKNKSKSKVIEKKSTILHSSLANTVLAHEGGSSYKKPILNKEKSKSHSHIIKANGSIAPGSPIKLVRAKLTEEVNNRLVSFGVDPLKNRLHRNLYKIKRMQLQKLQELKAKKNPAHDRVKHSILAYLDSTTADNNKEKVDVSSSSSISPSKLTKPFSLTSVISNVKNKALALVKSNDMRSKTERNLLQSEVARRALSLLKTPPDSATSSPVNKPQAISSKKHNIMDNINKEYSKTKRSVDLAAVAAKSLKVNEMAKLEDTTTSNESDSSETDESGNYDKTNVNQKTKKSIENLIKSPARQPTSATGVYIGNGHNIRHDDNKLMSRTQTATNILKHTHELTNVNNRSKNNNVYNSDESETNKPVKKSISEENILNIISKQTKGVLKSASSMSSLNKKKVLFDMDAIQMKSVSVSPSQSTTEKSDNIENYELGLVNLETEEWDISSIENEPLKNDTKIQVNIRASPKIAELKQSIESQLARRNKTPSTALVGGIDVLSGGMTRGTSLGGSNTSLGSSILDESEPLNHGTIVKPKKVTEKEDSEIDLSEFSIDGLIVKTKHDEF